VFRHSAMDRVGVTGQSSANFWHAHCTEVNVWFHASAVLLRVRKFLATGFTESSVGHRRLLDEITKNKGSTRLPLLDPLAPRFLNSQTWYTIRNHSGMSSSWLVNLSRSQRFVTWGVKLTSGSSFWYCLLYLRAYNVPAASLSLCISLFLCSYLSVCYSNCCQLLCVRVCVCAKKYRILRCNYIYSGTNSLTLPRTLLSTCSGG
jgi:hypothetical protein